MNSSMAHVLYLLQAHKWKKNTNRPNVSGVDEERKKRWKQGNPGKPCFSYTFGLVNKRCFKDPKLSKISEQEPEIYQALQDLAREIDPSFSYTSICVNKNMMAKPHVDGNNQGNSIIVGLGNYTGGELVVEYPDGNKVHDCKEKPCYFDGTVKHYTLPFQGDRYTIIYFSLKN